MRHKIVLLALALFATSTVMCQDYDAQVVISQEQEEKKADESKQEVPALSYYSSHLVTGLAALVGSNLCMYVIDEDFFYNPEVAPLNAKAFIAATIGCYILYKAPQWTDKSLGIKEERSGLCNVFSFLGKIALPYPINVLATEFILRQNS